MKVLLLAAISAFGLLGTDGAWWNLDKMIKKTTGKEAGPSYSDYGCNCGFRRKGAPVDTIDWCCAEHNCCYNRLENIGCQTRFSNYNIRFYWKTVNCASQNFCQAQVCECDKIMAFCFAINRKSYNTNYQYYNNRKCRGAPPKC
ncbi:phospholipase A2, membrane associated-like [Erinaceus europaeus]|uniref:Phospholipase A2 n=1 Tax=Erinaceus europaeus TaxID=9365 RepID=A0ABM3YBD7_ERIEU|nr:phospholipase A2, membrane associated-like [Erinaceus europaeus]